MCIRDRSKLENKFKLDQLTTEQRSELQNVLSAFADTFTFDPGKLKLTFSVYLDCKIVTLADCGPKSAAILT